MENTSLPQNLSLLRSLSREISRTENEGITCSVRRIIRAEEDYALEREKLACGLREILTKKQRITPGD